jgi:hypothetical protein
MGLGRLHIRTNGLRRCYVDIGTATRHRTTRPERDDLLELHTGRHAAHQAGADKGADIMRLETGACNGRERDECANRGEMLLVEHKVVNTRAHCAARQARTHCSCIGIRPCSEKSSPILRFLCSAQSLYNSRGITAAYRNLARLNRSFSINTQGRAVYAKSPGCQDAEGEDAEGGRDM